MPTDIAGFAIRASEEVDAKIREEIKPGTFPIRLKPEDWQSGSVNWLLDVIAPDRKTAGRVIANFRQVVKEGELRMHPQIAGLVEREMLEKMAAGSRGATERTATERAFLDLGQWQGNRTERYDLDERKDLDE
ncbi:MAG: hypothetical protein ACRCS0_08770 [Albidovulum sp.]